jgi:hypothetical protein
VEVLRADLLLLHLFYRVIGLVPGLDPARMAIDVPVAELDGAAVQKQERQTETGVLFGGLILS